MNKEPLKIPYISGPLTELPNGQDENIKKLYQAFADVCEETLGVRAFVPHEHFDPIENADASPEEIDRTERIQVCERTSLLVVVALVPTWGGGIEVEMAHRSNVPVWIFCEEEKLKNRKISRLLRGNPAVQKVIPFSTNEDALEKFRKELQEMKG